MRRLRISRAFGLFGLFFVVVAISVTAFVTSTATPASAACANKDGRIICDPLTGSTLVGPDGKVGPEVGAGPAAGATTATTIRKNSAAGEGAKWSAATKDSLKGGYNNPSLPPCERLDNADFGGEASSEDIYNRCVSSWNQAGINFTGNLAKQYENVPGRFPLEKYALDYEVESNGLGIPNIGQAIMGVMMDLFWAFAKFFVTVGLFLIEWTFGFELIENLAKFSSTVAKLINEQYVFDSVLQLRYLMIFALLIYCGFLFLKGRIGKAISEILVSCLILALAFVMLVPKTGWYGINGSGGPGGYLIGGYSLVGGLSGDITALMIQDQKGDTGGAKCSTAGVQIWCQGLNYRSDADWNKFLAAKCPNFKLQQLDDADAAIKQLRDNRNKVFCQVRATLAENFVGVPYEYAEFGYALEGQCAQIRDNEIAGGPWGSAPWIPSHSFFLSGDESDDTQINEQGGLRCHTYHNGEGAFNGGDVGNYNAHPNGQRMLITLLTMLAAAAAMISIAGMAVIVLAGQITAAALMAFAPIAVISGIAPGGGRNFFIRWAIMLAKDLIFVVVSSLFLAALVAILHLFLMQTQDLNLYVKFAGMVLISAFMFKLLKKMYTGTDNAASSFAMKMQGFRAGDAENNRMYARTDGRPLNTQWGGYGGVGAGGGRGGYGGGGGGFNAARVVNAMDPGRPIEGAARSTVSTLHRNTIGNIKGYTTYEGRQRRKGKYVADQNYQDLKNRDKGSKDGNNGNKPLPISRRTQQPQPQPNNNQNQHQKQNWNGNTPP